MHSHIAGTWLLANLLHPVILVFYFSNGFSFLVAEDLGVFLQLLFYSCLFSLPSLALGFLAGYLIAKIRGEAVLKLVAWIITAPCIALLNWLLIILVFFSPDLFFFEIIDVVAPAMLVAFIATVCRSHYFLGTVKRTGQQDDDSTKFNNLF
ncbi:MAG TPA: hypothetical protein VGO58_06840 [Chitinophagaceae bacterium]|jgi:hypothetical protein|nr:hypothetical protein [Chitinophagaceae bacterium]